jgi:nucleoside-diphosphate-sugar epimerase
MIRKILITGIGGFIGSALAARLGKNYCLVRPVRQELNLLDKTANLDSIIKKENVDTIVHLANPRIYTTTDSMGQSLLMLKNVLDVCRENRLTLLYTSSWVVYSGYNTTCLFASESLPVRPKGTYGEAKALCEILINQYRDLYNLNIYMLRLSPVYGVGSNKPNFISTFFQKALTNETIFTHKYINGLPVFDLIYIDDVVRAIEAVVKTDPGNSLDLNIGSGIGYSTFDIAKLIKEISCSNSPIMHQQISDFACNIVMDTGKAREILKWHPEINIKDGLKEMMCRIVAGTNMAEIEYEK